MKYGLFYILKKILSIIHIINVKCIYFIKKFKILESLLSGMGSKTAESTVIGFERLNCVTASALTDFQ